MRQPWLGRTIKERFFALVNKTETCWLWRGAHNGLGYGKFWVAGRGPVYAHRVSAEMHNINIPEGMNVLHSCDVPACVNPDHLWIGTMKDNTQDAAAKGRLSSGPEHGAKIINRLRGENNPHSKLSLEKVANIRSLAESGTTHSSIAKMFNISRGGVSRVVRGEIWK